MNRKLIFLLFFCFSFLAYDQIFAEGDSLKLVKGLPLSQYYKLIDEYATEGDLDAALSVCDTVEKYLPGQALTYEHQADAYLREDRWEETIEAAQKALALDSTSISSRKDFFLASRVLHQNTAALKEYNKRNPPLPDYNTCREWRIVDHWSDVGTGILIGGLILVFFIFYRREIMGGSSDTRNLSIPYLILIPAAICCILYILFFHFSALILSGNARYPIMAYNPYSIRGCTFEHDGMEGFVLYGLFAVALILSVGLAVLIRFLGARLQAALFWVLAVVSFCYFVKIGFYPPYESIDPVVPMTMVYTSVFVSLLWAVNLFFVRYPRIALWIVAVLLVPFTFLIGDWFSIYDYDYVLSPALRLSYGDRIRDIYFQYDVFLSLLSLMWIKLKFAIDRFYLLSELGYYLFFVALFIFSRRFFQNKKLPFLFLVSAVLIRYYANMGPNSEFQVTPWRLDLWLPLLWLVYWRGAYHWLVAIFAGLLVIFHRNFGFIYLAAYLQLLLALLIADLSRIQSFKEVWVVILAHIRKSLVNIGIITIAFVCSYFILGGVVPESALAYRKIGIGMMRISPVSFYWYVPVVLGAIVLLLIRKYKTLPQKYFTAGLFMVLLAVGNSLYFFGRSHEHNIINLSALLILCFFFLVDVMYAGVDDRNLSAPVRWKMRLYHLIPFLFIILICFYYPLSLAGRINGLKFSRFGAANPISFWYDFESLKDITHSSDKVFFLEFGNDFLNYYNGHYRPVGGYFTPNDAWVLKKDMAVMLQNLLDSGYYITPTDDQYADEFMRLLDFNAYAEKGGSRVFYKTPHKNVFNADHTVLHRSFVNRLPARGIDVSAFNLGHDFSVQCILQPDSGHQVLGATVFSNMHTTLGNQGMELYCIDTARGAYVFQYGFGSQISTSPEFVVKQGVQNNILISAGDSLLTISVNGAIHTIPYLESYSNSDRPLMIGTNRTRSAPFRGLIYELKIADSKLTSNN